MKKLLFLLMLVTLAACGKDEYHYPSVKLAYLTGYSDSQGALQHVQTDDGSLLTVAQDATGLAIRPDSLIRMVANYETTEQGTTVYGALAAIAPVPQPAEQFTDGIQTDPAEVLSIWLGWNYLNIILNVKAQNKQHSLHFIEDKVEETDGQTDVYLRLFHDDGDDLQAYTKRAYLSVPLLTYARADGRPTTIHFSLLTYDGTTQAYEFNYTPQPLQKQ